MALCVTVLFEFSPDTREKKQDCNEFDFPFHFSFTSYLGFQQVWWHNIQQLVLELLKSDIQSFSTILGFFQPQEQKCCWGCLQPHSLWSFYFWFFFKMLYALKKKRRMKVTIVVILWFFWNNYLFLCWMTNMCDQWFAVLCTSKFFLHV